MVRWRGETKPRTSGKTAGRTGKNEKERVVTRSYKKQQEATGSHGKPQEAARSHVKQREAAKQRDPCRGGRKEAKGQQEEMQPWGSGTRRMKRSQGPAGLN